MLQEIELQRSSATVLRAHPDASEILNDPAFEAWVAALDEEDQARASSAKASDAIKTLDQFKRDKMLAELLDSQKSPQQTTSRSKPKLDVDPNPRNRQSPVAARPQAGNAYGSEEEAWTAFVEWQESQQAARR